MGVVGDRPRRFGCLSPEEARNEYRRMLLKTEIAPPAIGEMSDLAVPGPDGPMRLRRYVPADAGQRPVRAILFIHGGGCVIGDIESHDVFCRTLCHDTARDGVLARLSPRAGAPISCRG